jgi:hypothetical protein
MPSMMMGLPSDSVCSSSMQQQVGQQQQQQDM